MFVENPLRTSAHLTDTSVFRDITALQVVQATINGLSIDMNCIANETHAMLAKTISPGGDEKTIMKFVQCVEIFKEYLRVGYYPFYDGEEIQYYSRIENVISFITDQEMTLFCGIDPTFTRKIKAMLLYLAANVPYEVNISKLASYLELNKNTVLNYLNSLQRAELLHLLYSDNKSVTKMQKPDKIFIHNTNMLCALTEETVIGTLRECFVVNQLSVGHTIEYSKTQGDFKVDGKWIFEVGGPDKSFDQIADLPNSYVLADSLEYPIGKKLPLWIVGLLY